MAVQAQRGTRVIAPIHSQPGAGRKWVISTTLWPPCPPRKILYPFYKKLPVPRGRSGRLGKFHRHMDSILGPYRPQRVSVATVLSRLPFVERQQNTRRNTVAYFTLHDVMLQDTVVFISTNLSHEDLSHVWYQACDKFWVWFCTEYFVVWVSLTSMVFKVMLFTVRIFFFNLAK
jgi:hypothetical protein